MLGSPVRKLVGAPVPPPAKKEDNVEIRVELVEFESDKGDFVSFDVKQ
jgi:hypothetical protein